MARLITCGFEAQLLGTSGPRDPEGEALITSGTVTVTTTAPASGAACVSCAGGAANMVTVVPTTVLGQTYFAKGRYKTSGTPAVTCILLQIKDTTGVFASIGLSTLKRPTLRNETGAVLETAGAAATMTDNTWYVIEVYCKVSAAGNTILGGRVLADDGTLLHQFAEYSVAIRNLAINGFRWGHCTAAASTVTIGVDDIALNDDQGSDQNSYCGPGRVFLAKPVADSAVGTGWQDGAGGTSNIFNSCDNTPPIGAATAAAGTQIKNAVSTAGSSYDAQVQDYTTVGVPSGDRIVLTHGVFRTAGSSATGTNDGAARVVSNPADAGDTTLTAAFDIVAGAEPGVGWTTFKTPIVYSPSVVRGTKPVLRLTKNTAATRIHYCDLMGLQIESAPPLKLSATPATETDAAVKPPVTKMSAGAHRGAETDTAVAVSVTTGGPQHITPVAATEADAAANSGAKKRVSATPGAETDASVVQSMKKRVQGSPATENDVATPGLGAGRWSILKKVAKIAATESDIARIPVRLWHVTPASESDAAVLRSVTKQVSGAHRATETDAAVAAVYGHGHSVTPATESDAAVNPGTKKRVHGVNASETDAAVAHGVTKVYSQAHRAAETDSAVALVLRKLLVVTPATSTGAAVNSGVKKRVHGTPAAETDLALSRQLTYSLTPATESDLARPAIVRKRLPGEVATEVDAAVARAVRKLVGHGFGSETDVGVDVTFQGGQTISVTPATESDSALSLFWKHIVHAIATAEADTGVARPHKKLRVVTPATEHDLATIKFRGRFAPAIETDTAIQIFPFTVAPPILEGPTGGQALLQPTSGVVVRNPTAGQVDVLILGGSAFPDMTGGQADTLPTGGEAELQPTGGEPDPTELGGQVDREPTGGFVFVVPTGGLTEEVPPRGGTPELTPTGGEVESDATGGEVETLRTGGQVELPDSTGGEPDPVPARGGQVEIHPTGGQEDL